MRVPISWMREFVDIPQDITHEQVHEALVRMGFEEEDVHTFDVFGPVVVGQVVEFIPEAQTNGKTINWCQVDVGELPGSPSGRDIRGIVCGAHNFVAGDKVVVCLPGSVLPGPFPIAARKTYGHVSDGMIASLRELGLGEEHDGILRLASLGLDPEPGTDAIELLGLDDFAVEVNVTPDRGYAFSVRGLAREYAISTGSVFRDLATEIVSPERSGFPVTIEDHAPIRGRSGCTTFTAGVVRGIDNDAPTPAWMTARLQLAGIRSISLVVDVSNYVMLELGQPTHTYDLAKVTGGLIVRRARASEQLTTLDGKLRTLDPEDLVIADSSVAIGLAGVMGGADTEISSTTSDVLVEGAIWDPVSISRSVRRHRLPSEAAKRYERGVDPYLSPVAVTRVIQLLAELGGGVPDTLGFTWDASVPPAGIALPDGFAQSIMGDEYSTAEITGSLEAVGATVEPVSNGWIVTPPTWRPDLTDRWTLTEEIARIVGYDRIPSVLPIAPPGRGLNRQQKLRRSSAAALAAGGLTEVLAYPFVSQESNDTFGSAAAGVQAPGIKIANALDPDAAFMRRSLMPGLITVARRNLSRGLTDLALFEIGTVVLPEPGTTYGSGALPAGNVLPDSDQLDALRASIPAQPWHVAALFLGDAVSKQPGQAAVPNSLADALAVARQLSVVLSVEINVVKGSHQALHPGRTAQLLVGDSLVGFAGELLPSLAADLDLPRVVAVLELDLDALVEASATQIIAKPISSLPAATQDVSLVVSDAVAAGDVLAVLIEGAGPLLERVALVDDYRGAGIPEGSKSLTYALRFRASDRTLTAAEATEAKTSAVTLAAARYGATLRE
jgi:phenylalanyl-tRNA synthetase beta chain